MRGFCLFLLVVSGFFLFTSVSASVFLVSPVSQELEPNASFLLGSVMPGETLELIFSNEDGKGAVWDRIEIVSESLADSWTVSSPQFFAESIVVSLQIPPTETEKLQVFRVRLWENANPLHAQEFSLQLFVKNDLVFSSVSSLQDSIVLGESATYKLVLVNNSLSSHSVVVRSSLPSFWFEPHWVFLEPKPSPGAVRELTLQIKPQAYGLRDFSFWVDSELNDKRLAVFENQLLIEPTLKGKFQSGLFGFSFFSPNLSVFYFFNALLGSFQ